MTTTTMPQDIDDIRHALAAVTGSPLGDIGSLPDASHKASGGYHCGAFDLRAINAVANNDYSIRQPRDRTRYYADLSAGRNRSSAIDYPDDWPNGGRQGWINFNNLLRRQLGARDPALVAIRGTNYTPDGTTKRRFDCLTLNETSTTDTVTWHTHIEFWRDLEGAVQRRWAKDRLVAIARSAITGAPLDAPAAAAPANPLLEEHMQIVTVLSPPAGQQSINGKTLTNYSRGYITPAGFWGLDDNNYGKFHTDTDYWNHSPEFTWPEIQGLVASLQQNPAAIVSGVLQGLASDPASSVTQADVDKILAEIAKLPAATRQSFHDQPLT